MRFTKAHGLGNDFILLDDRAKTLCGLDALARALCDRHTGIGGDGVILFQNSAAADVRMVLFNSDGSEARMCGNGIRCFAKYIYDHRILKKESFTVETLAGVMEVTLEAERGRAKTVAVNMGRPVFEREKIPVAGTGEYLLETLEAGGRAFLASALLMGVPHAVVFVDRLDEAEVMRFGPLLENHPLFLQKANVDFVQVIDRQNIKLRTWERGCGATLACGTGAAASAVCAARAGFTESTVNAHLVLGSLLIEHAADGGVRMKGPAELVYEGEVNLSRFQKQ